jgi:hypothetical protein
MAIERKQVGETETYHGRKLRARFMGPDLLGFVGDMELSGFFLDVEAAHAAGRRHVDAEIKAEQEAAKAAEKARKRA